MPRKDEIPGGDRDRGQEHHDERDRRAGKAGKDRSWLAEAVRNVMDTFRTNSVGEDLGPAGVGGIRETVEREAAADDRDAREQESDRSRKR